MNIKQQLMELNAVVDNEYLAKYLELISINRLTPKIKFVTQQHHIVPKYIFNNNHLAVDNSKANLVNLKFSDHLLAHYYLMRCSANTLYELANANAIIKSYANPHSKDLEGWLLKNKALLDQINSRRCELISLHHTDVSGIKNPRATKVYQYSTAAELETAYDTIKQCAEIIAYSPDSLRAMLSKNKIFNYNNKLYSKFDNLSKQEIFEYLQHLAAKTERKEYNFTCEYCGKTYTMLLNTAAAETATTKRHFCAICITSGKAFIGVQKSTEQKLKMHNAAKIRMHAVECVETVEVFESVSAAMRVYSGDIKRCLSGKRETAGGYHWKYLEREK